MKRFKPAVLILYCIPLAGAMVHPDAVQRWRLASGPGLAAPDWDAVDEVFAAYDHTDTPGCALGVVQGGELVYARGYGMAKRGYGIAITPQSVFRTGSLAKQFTAAAIAIAVRESALSLDDPVRKWIQTLPSYPSDPTIRHMVHHTSGLRDYLTLMPSTQVSLLMQEYGFHGPAMNVSAMCASGNAGLITAKMWLDTGFVDDVVFLATDLSATPENIEHFIKLGVAAVDAEPQDVCRPFQKGSRGFGAGEAATAFVLTGRSEGSYGRMLGGAMSHDGFHATSIDPDLTQVRRCFEEALSHAGVTPLQVRYLNAHGPGTAQCDAAETAILESLLESRSQVYSIKPLTGHCQGAASAIETAAAVLGFERNLVPAAPRVADGHPLLLDGFTPAEAGLTVKSSLGMGGHNSVVVLAPA